VVVNGLEVSSDSRAAVAVSRMFWTPHFHFPPPPNAAPAKDEAPAEEVREFNPYRLLVELLCTLNPSSSPSITPTPESQHPQGSASTPHHGKPARHRAETPGSAMPIQDWQDIRSWLIFRGERMRAHRHGEILCCKSHQQETHGGKRTYGENECRSNSAYD
jgi:hypothetical protein